MMTERKSKSEQKKDQGTIQVLGQFSYRDGVWYVQSPKVPLKRHRQHLQ